MVHRHQVHGILQVCVVAHMSHGGRETYKLQPACCPARSRGTMQTTITSTFESSRSLALDLSVTDDDLVARVCAGEYSTFEIIMERHRARLSRMIAGIVK